MADPIRQADALLTPADMTLADLQHWTWVVGRAQQMLMTHAAELATGDAGQAIADRIVQSLAGLANDPAGIALPDEHRIADFWKLQGDLMAAGVELWTNLMTAPPDTAALAEQAAGDRRFSHESWQRHPLFATISQTYLFVADRLLLWADGLNDIDPAVKQQLRFQTRTMVDAMSPSNFPLTNPEVIERTIETRGDNLLKGLEHMLADLRQGQLTQTARDAFTLGGNIAATPGKIVHRTPLYELIQYSPVTENVLKVPLVIFPPWINRYYILDLGEKKSFVRWAVAQGITVFMVSWKSADASMKDVSWDDYIAAQIDAVDAVREILDVPAAHAIGYCVGGTTLAATLAVAAAKGEAARFASATYFTAQVDFSEAGELLNFLAHGGADVIAKLDDDGYIDGRYLAATFNLLRGRELIWSYVVNNYLLGNDYAPFDLLYWNGDSTNLPARWHADYLRDLYGRNLLAVPDALRALDVPIDLGRVTTPSFLQAGREDHIAPPGSVWKAMHLMGGKKRFMLAGSGHIAGVVNPPGSNKYQYWTNERDDVASLDDFVAGATEHPGSWWPYWVEWLKSLDAATVTVEGPRRPEKGKGARRPDAPGEYVRLR